jgi:hypothetical protein
VFGILAEHDLLFVRPPRSKRFRGKDAAKCTLEAHAPFVFERDA